MGALEVRNDGIDGRHMLERAFRGFGYEEFWRQALQRIPGVRVRIESHHCNQWFCDLLLLVAHLLSIL